MRSSLSFSIFISCFDSTDYQYWIPSLQEAPSFMLVSYIFMRPLCDSFNAEAVEKSVTHQGIFDRR